MSPQVRGHARGDSRNLGRNLWRAVLLGAAFTAAAGSINSLRNLRVVPAPDGQAEPPATAEMPTVSILLPLRDEAHRVEPCLHALAQQECAEIIVLDDNSRDGTADLVHQVLGADPRLTLLREYTEPPAGWLGKPWACARLAAQAHGEVLVFVDADVVLAPDAVTTAVAMALRADYDVLCPYPRQLTAGILGRLVQPLLQWSWLTTLVVDRAATSPRPSTATGNGQFLVIRQRAYTAAGGHRAVRAEVIEDVALVRAVKAVGGFGGMADGTWLATCRMYDCDAELVAGYTKSLWSAFGSPLAAAGAVGLLAAVYVAPAVAVLVGPTHRDRLWGAAGYVAAATGRVAVARRTGGRSPDALAHPGSIVAFGVLVVESFRRRRSGSLSWRGRPVVAAPHDSEVPRP